MIKNCDSFQQTNKLFNNKLFFNPTLTFNKIPFFSGYFDYSVQEDLVCKVELEDVPYFNAPIYLENKEQIGKIDEIFGNIRDYSVTVKLGENMNASSFKKSQKVIYLYSFYLFKLFQKALVTYKDLYRNNNKC